MSLSREAQEFEAAKKEMVLEDYRTGKAEAASEYRNELIELEGFSRQNKQELENSTCKKSAQEKFDKLEAELVLSRKNAKVEFQQAMDELKEERDQDLEDLLRGSDSDEDETMYEAEEEQPQEKKRSAPSRPRMLSPIPVFTYNQRKEYFSNNSDEEGMPASRGDPNRSIAQKRIDLQARRRAEDEEASQSQAARGKRTRRTASENSK